VAALFRGEAVSLSVKALVRFRDGNRCVDCHTSGTDYLVRTGRLLDVHRLIPGSTYSVSGCVTVCRLCHKKRHRKPPTETVRMPIDLVRRITILAAHRGQSVPEYLAEILRPIADRHHAEMLDELCRERGLPLPRATRKRSGP
jgi:hypothetical protein